MMTYYVAPGIIKNLSPVFKYRRDYLSIEWLEKYLSDYFNIDIKALSSCSEFAKHRQFKAVSYYIIWFFGGYTRKELSRRYNISETMVTRCVNDLAKEYPSDINFISKDLKSKL